MSSYALEGTAPKPARRRVAWLGIAAALVLVVGMGSAAGYLHWANRLPPLPPETRVYPNPNGLDRVVNATKALPYFRRQSPLSDPLRAKLPALKAALGQYEGTLPKLRAAVTLPFLNPPIRTTDHPPRYSDSFIQAARLLTARARVELAAGHSSEAIDWALDAVELGSRAGRGAPAFVNQQARECSMLGAAMAETCVPHLTLAKAVAAGRRLDRLAAQFPTFPEIMQEERRFRVGARHRVLTGADPAWVGGRAPSAYAMWEAKTKIFLSPKPALLADLDRDYLALEAYAGKPWPQRRQANVPCEKINRWLADRAGDALATNDAQLRIVRLELALYAHHRRQGVFPQTLAELNGRPELVMREDPFTGQPFRYCLTAGGYQLYSYGRDAVDHGGDPQMDVVAGRFRSLD